MAEPVSPSLHRLLEARGAPWPIRRRLADAVVASIHEHAPATWRKYTTWALLRTTDTPDKRGEVPMAKTAGRVIEDTPKQRAAAAAQGRKAATNVGPTPEQAELDTRRGAKRTAADRAREAFLEQSGFGAVLERAEALLADLPRAREEHRRAQAALPDLVTLMELAREAPEDRLLARFARRADDLRRTIQAEPQLVASAEALRGLIARIKMCDVGDANGPVRNSNVAAAWRRQFAELVTPLPSPGYAESCARAVAALLAEARAARGEGA